MYETKIVNYYLELFSNKMNVGIAFSIVLLLGISLLHTSASQESSPGCTVESDCILPVPVATPQEAGDLHNTAREVQCELGCIEQVIMSPMISILESMCLILPVNYSS